MRKVLILAAALILGAAAFAQDRVSTPIVKALESGKFYMKLGMNLGGGRMTVETASRGGVVMSRTHMRSMDAVSLSADGRNYQLDEEKKTWRMQPGAMAIPTTLKFVRQGSCKLNGADGWYFDEYRATDGSSVVFYYNSTKVAAIDMAGAGTMTLQSFSTTIPAHMYFCVGPDWKGQGIAPPVCSTRWTDSGTPVELAAGGSLLGATVTDVHAGGSISLSDLSPSQEIPQSRTDLKVTGEGIKKAMVQLSKEMEGKSPQEIVNEIIDFDNKLSRMMMVGVVSGELVEMAVARCAVYPHPSLLTTTGNLLLEVDMPDSALEYFESAAKLAPNNEEPLYGQVESLLDMNKPEKARQVVPKIIEITRKRKAPDGRAWLYRAMLTSDKEPMQAAADLFHSLALGYFDENSAALIASLLNELDKAELNASADEQDFMALIHQVYSQENLANIRKGISFGFKQSFGEDFADLNATPAGDLEANRRQNAFIARDFENKSEAHLKKAEAATEGSPSIKLYTAMEATFLPASLSSLMDEAKNRKESLKAENMSAAARDAINKLQLSQTVISGLERAYAKISGQLATDYQVESLYMPDLRTFWCLRLLERYYKYYLDYAYGTFGSYDDEHGTFHGYLPEGLKAEMLSGKTRLAKYKPLSEAMTERHVKEAESLGKKCVKEYDDWLDNHPNASEEACERARRRIFKPFYVLIEVTQPLERLDQLTTPEEKDAEQAYVLYYNSTIRPVLDAWWKDISKYAQYCYDPHVTVYFWYTNLASIYSEYSATFASKASRGDILHITRQAILKRKAELDNQDWQDHQEQLNEYFQAKRDERDLKEFKGTEFHGLSDLYISMNTPSGKVDFGLKKGEFGIHIDVKDSYIQPQPIVARQAEKDRLITDDMAGAISNALQGLSSLPSEYFGKKIDPKEGIAGPNFDALNLAVRAATGKLLVTKDSDEYNVARDSHGNLQFRRVQGRDTDIMGYGNFLSEDIQAGRIKARREVASVGFFGGGFSLNLGSTTIKR